MSMLDDPKCLWKFGQFLTFEARSRLIFVRSSTAHLAQANAEALVFWLNVRRVLAHVSSGCDARTGRTAPPGPRTPP